MTNKAMNMTLIILVISLMLSKVFAHELYGRGLISMLIAALLTPLFVAAFFINFKNKYKQYPTLICFIFFMFWFAGFSWLGVLSHKLEFLKIEDNLISFKNEILLNASINSMSTGDRYYKELNGQLITYTPSQVRNGGTGLNLIRYYKNVLIENSISLEKYEKYRIKLRLLKFIDFQYIKPMLVFTIDGFLDNCYGLAFLENGSKNQILGKQTSCGSIVYAQKVSDGWFYYGTS